MTLGQFLEMRYSRNFRLYMGFLAFLSGILNYGVFPAISARFFIYFLGLPQTVSLGLFTVSTFAMIMFCYLAATVWLILVGGQVTMMITDCLEGMLSHLIYIIIALAVFYVVSWRDIIYVMETAPPGKSWINPFDTSEVRDFNIWFVITTFLLRVYTQMALQNKQGFNSAAKSAHESRMAGILGEWRGYARTLMLLLLGVCAVTFMNHPALSAQSAPAHESIKAIKDAYIQKQMTVPIALSYLLPTGIKGLFCAMMVMGLLAGDAGHMHSWGSIFVQDVVLPLRKTSMTPKQHLWALRAAVLSVAIFAFLFSMLWTQTQFISLWWNMTAGVFTGAAGAAIIGGLYWSRGTTPAAWAGAVIGSTASLLGVICSNPKGWGWVKKVVEPHYALPEKFWLNGQWTAFWAACITVAVYIVVALLTSQRRFNLDRMLHRGEYADPKEKQIHHPTLRERFSVGNIFRFDQHFTRWDKLIAAGIFWWSLLLLAINLVVTVWNLSFERWTIDWWAHYWMIFGIGLPCVLALATLIWFSIGGIRDMIDFFRALRTMKRDARDDGRVAPTGEEPAPGFEVIEKPPPPSVAATASK
jgi:SSS family solute:Na+ symporter